MPDPTTIDPNADRTNATIQTAVDAATATGGGRVTIPPGVYTMHDALHLRSGVTVVGDGEVTLRKAPSVSSPIADFIGYGHYEFTVAEPDRFQVGMGVQLTDDNANGFYETVATIVGREGDLFFIDRMLNHDYLPTSNAVASSVYPLVDGYHVQNARLENVQLDGNPAETRRLSGCRGGGVFLLGCHHMELEAIEILNYRGDALSFQQSTDVWVTDCHLHDNHGGGLHPGSGSVRYILRGNHIHDNQGDGIFYCLRTTHSICEHNRIENNGGTGISIGERDTHHLIRHNTICGNGNAGVTFRKPLVRSGDDVRLEANTFAANSGAAIVVPAGIRRVHVTANTFERSDEPAMTVESGCESIHFTANTVNGREQAAADVSGPVVLQPPAEPLPPIGPAAAALDGIRHLGRGPLAPWS
jgi:hypothetical protein